MCQGITVTETKDNNCYVKPTKFISSTFQKLVLLGKYYAVEITLLYLRVIPLKDK